MIIQSGDRAAIASVTEEVVFGAKETVFHEGEKGDTLFLVVEGDVAVIKDMEGGEPLELDHIGAGDYFGEMALFGDDRRSATIQVREAARFLTLQKQELQEIVPSPVFQHAPHEPGSMPIRIHGLTVHVPEQVVGKARHA